MKVLVIVKATQRSEAGLMPDEKLLTEMGNFNEELAKAGILVSAEGLHPSSKGVRVQFSGEKRTVIDGPFAETKELVAGFWIWRVQSMAEAIEWVKRCPNPMITDSEIEIRPVLEAENFGEAFKPELREQEALTRAQTLGIGIPRFENGVELRITGLKQSYMFTSRVSIPSQWERFVPQIERIPGRVGQTFFGVCSSYKTDGGFDYLSGVEVSPNAEVPDEFTTEKIPANRHVVFVHNDHVSMIPETIGKIWNQWLPESGFKAADGPCFERYTEQFNPRTGVGGVEIWIPIQTGR